MGVETAVTNWVVEPEYIACIILVILFVYANLQRFASSPKQTAFRCSLLISLAAVVINIGSVHCIQDISQFPMWLNYSVNAWYFAFTPLMVASISLAALMLVYEDHYDRRGFRSAVVIFFLLYMALLIMVLLNGSMKLLFYFTEDGAYTRGPLNAILLPFTILCILVDVVCYICERRQVNRSFRRVMCTLPVIAALFGLTQFLSPDVMLTGSAAAISLLVLFVNGQLQRLNADQLTDLGTRELFYRMIERNVQRGRPFHVIIVSIRNYKDVNTRFGQRGGDAFLRSIGDYLFHLKDADACRFTGVEFAIITRASGEAAYEALYAGVRNRFNEPWHAGGRETLLSASFADIAYPELVSNVNDMTASLEYASRLAKQGGAGATVRFDKQLRSAFGRRNYIIEVLNNAMREDRFYLNFQPVFDCNTGCLNGAEALIRLREDSGQPISPGEFMPLAEETGLVVDIGWLVLERVLTFINEHRELPLKWISVNVSAQQYQSPGFVERIEALLERYELGRSILKLEITERVLVEDIDRARETMLALHKIGVGTGLDDFGTGYSNFANVMSLPFEVVKIDKSYIDDVTTSQYSFGLLETIISAIRAMNMLVLAEGVETQEQLKMMEWLKVDNIQGYFFSRPLEEDAFVETMKQSLERAKDGAQS